MQAEARAGGNGSGNGGTGGNGHGPGGAQRLRSASRGADGRVVGPGGAWLGAPRLESVLLGGFVCRKHGQQGRPKERRFWVNPRFSELHWDSAKKGKLPWVDLTRVTAVKRGVLTKNFGRHGKADRAHCCLSLVTPERTLDLETDNQQQRDLLARAFEQVLDLHRQHRLARAQGHQAQGVPAAAAHGGFDSGLDRFRDAASRVQRTAGAAAAFRDAGSPRSQHRAQQLEQQERMQQLRAEQGGAANPWASRGSTR